MSLVMQENEIAGKYRNSSENDIISRLQSVKSFIRDEFIYGGHWLALGGSFLVLTIMLFLQISIHWEFLVVAYLSGMIIYGYDRYRDIATDSSDNVKRSNHLKRCSRFLPFALMGYGIAFFALILFFGTLESIVFGAIFVSGGVLYTHGSKKVTKKIMGFKTYYTAFFVASLVIFTMLYCSYQFYWAVPILFVFLFLRMFIDCSFCDIKDMDADQKNHLLTFPVVLGKERFLKILHLLNIFSFLPIFIGVALQVIPMFSLFLLISSFVSIYYIEKARNSTTDIRSLISYVVDGEFVVFPIALMIGALIL
jgi:4-hydroxybenzoate polyprenyltransferase